MPTDWLPCPGKMNARIGPLPQSRAAWPLGPHRSRQRPEPRIGGRGSRKTLLELKRCVPMIRKFLIAAAALAIPAAAVASPSAVFLRKAIDGNYSEVMLGRQIQARGASGQVRNFGAMLVRDH